MGALAAGQDRTVGQDIADLLAAVAWPLVFVIAVWLLREPLADLFRGLPTRLKSVSFAGFSLELVTADEGSLSRSEVAVDLRHEGAPTDVNDSTLRAFYEQINDPTRVEYAVVDLGAGREWLSSRLFILALIMRRMRGLQALVFVHTRDGVARTFLGVCGAEALRWRIGGAVPRFESALAMAELRLWGHPYQMRGGAPLVLPAVPPQPPFTIPAVEASQAPDIVNDEGRILLHGWPQPAADLLRYFLDAVQEPAILDAQGALVSPDGEGWEVLPKATPPLAEFATWLSAGQLDRLLGKSLRRAQVRWSDLQGWDNRTRLRAWMEQDGDWVAVLRDDGSFDRLVDRRKVVDRAAAELTKG